MKKLLLQAMGMYLNALAIVSPARAAKKGFNLFCRPFRATLKHYHLEFLETAEQFTIPCKGQNIQAYRWGSGPRKVLFLHGWQSHSFRWKAYIEAFKAEGGYSLYAVDAPGHGLSDGKFLSVPLYSDLILHLISTLGKMDAIVSHSMGGFSTLYSFHRQPALPVDKVVIMGSPGEARDFFNFYSDSLSLSSKTSRIIEDYFVSIFQQRPEYFSAPAFAQSVPSRGLIIHDEADEEAPHRYAQQIHKAWPQSTLVSTQGLGHNLKSPEIVKMVADFVGKNSAEDVVRQYPQRAIPN